MGKSMAAGGGRLPKGGAERRSWSSFRPRPRFPLPPCGGGPGRGVCSGSISRGDRGEPSPPSLSLPHKGGEDAGARTPDTLHSPHGQTPANCRVHSPPEAVIPGRSEAEGKGIQGRFDGTRGPWVPFPRFAHRGRRQCMGQSIPRTQVQFEFQLGTARRRPAPSSDRFAATFSREGRRKNRAAPGGSREGRRKSRAAPGEFSSTSPPLSPPPLWGRAREGGMQRLHQPRRSG